MSKIVCQLCGAEVHSIQLHLRKDHQDEGIDVGEYQSRYPNAPLLSDEAIAQINRKKVEMSSQKTEMAGAATAGVVHMTAAQEKRDLHEVFGLGRSSAARNAKGDGIPITVLGSHEFSDFIPMRDDNYVMDIELLKTALMGIELNLPTYLWGHAGTGKTTIWEQICHYTNRPYFRVQHTANMAESDVTGQWTVKNGETKFELGPLALAMKHGWVYLADEYDFAFPSILGVYQPVLEGKSLIIKEADAENRIIKPHPNFRFVATGNTNGAGDDTGLYQGTNLQNAANFSRFAITYQVGYMPQKHEVLLVKQQGQITEEDAKQLVSWANEVRKAYDGRKIGATVGPRELINSARIGSRKASFRLGVQLSVTNRWSQVDREIGEELAQRHIASL